VCVCVFVVFKMGYGQSFDQQVPTAYMCDSSVLGVPSFTTEKCWKLFS
jgi:hypothetical protein